jgi:hypothetical protein
MKIVRDKSPLKKSPYTSEGQSPIGARVFPRKTTREGREGIPCKRDTTEETIACINNDNSMSCFFFSF